MTNPDLHEPVTTESAPPADVPTALAWQAEASALLRRVADLCVDNGVDVDTFMRSAWATYVEARPGMREELEARQLQAQLSVLRDAGKIALA